MLFVIHKLANIQVTVRIYFESFSIFLIILKLSFKYFTILPKINTKFLSFLLLDQTKIYLSLIFYEF